MCLISGCRCFADVKPRKFDAAACVMMNNLSELVVRQLEKVCVRGGKGRLGASTGQQQMRWQPAVLVQRCHVEA
jgi:hypothetical protein